MSKNPIEELTGNSPGEPESAGSDRVSGGGESDEKIEERPDRTAEGTDTADGTAPESDRESGRVRTRRTRGLATAALLALAVGIVATSPAVIGLAGIPVAIIAYHRITMLPPVELSGDRSVSTVHVVPGETVTVSVTVTNEGETNVPDLRVADGVPEGVRVVEGEPTGQFALGPGESATLSYTVRARRGRHEFEAIHAVCRNTSGSDRRQIELPASNTLVSGIDLDTVPLASRAGQYAGRLETPISGGGVEFFSTREYHPSDSASDIDWRRFARTGEFTTIEYKDTRAASIHLVVDVRRAARALSSSDGVTAAELCLYAAEHIAESLLAERHEIGLTVVGTDRRTLFPRRTPEQYRRIRKQLTGTEIAPRNRGPDTTDSETNRNDHSDGDGEFTGTGSLDARRADELVERTSSHTQFVCLTALADDGFDEFFDRLARHERPVLTVSPRIDRPDTPGNRLLTSRRDMRIETLERAGIRVLDWETSDPLWLAIERRAGGLWR